ncbi:hypothetical protein PV341_33815 [Streptomyces sp. PA03-1a]|nr:hypothetical protein [Streptomyces sp. PA03-1a]
MSVTGYTGLTKDTDTAISFPALDTNGHSGKHLLLGRMLMHGMPVDRFNGQFLYAYETGTAERRLHADLGCDTYAGAKRPVAIEFHPAMYHRLCSCYKIPTPAGSSADHLAQAVFHLNSTLEELEEADYETERREEPPYEPANIHLHSWRSLQDHTTKTAQYLRHHSWLQKWAQPRLDQMQQHLERMRKELLPHLNVTAIEEAASQLRSSAPSPAYYKDWHTWRNRKEDDPTPFSSPDDAVCSLENLYIKDPTSDPIIGKPVPKRSRHLLSLRLPPIADWYSDDWAADPLTTWEVAVTAAYQISTNWETGRVLLIAPDHITEELFCSARDLDVVELPHD